ncbi:MAG: lytic transglycosylase domain-containing protein [Myxococcota bacterium]
MGTPSGAPARFAAWVEEAARVSGVPSRLLAAVVSVESAWEAGAMSTAGAMGLMQLMPGTARNLGVDPWDPRSNLVGGARYLAALLGRFGDLGFGLAAYNAGPARVLAAVRDGQRLPEETLRYVPHVLERMAALAPRLTSTGAAAWGARPGDAASPR